MVILNSYLLSGHIVSACGPLGVCELRRYYSTSGRLSLSCSVVTLVPGGTVIMSVFGVSGSTTQMRRASSDGEQYD